MVPHDTRFRSHALLSLLILFGLSMTVRAQSAAGQPSISLARPKYGAEPAQPVGAMPLVAPIFLQTDQIDSSISVVNSTQLAANATITMRDQQGNVIGESVLTFPSHSATPIALIDLLKAAGSQAHSGSVTLTQDPAVKGPALLAQLSMTLHAGSRPSFLEEEFGMPTPHGSAVLQGVASQTMNLPLVAVTSVSEVAQTIHASCVGENTPAGAFELPPYGTIVMQACSWKAIQDKSLNLSSSLASVGGTMPEDHAVSLTSDSVPGAFYAFGFALNGGLAQPQLQPLDFYDPNERFSTSIVYVGIPVGATPALNAVLSAPNLTLANFSSQPRQTLVTLAESSTGSPRVWQLAALTIPPLSTKTVTLSQGNAKGMLNTFTITSDGTPGEVQAHLYTQFAGSNQRIELLAKDARDDHNGGDHPWSIANGDSSTLLLYNATSQPQRFQVRISGSGSSWLQVLQLSANETRSISINDIVNGGVLDAKGNKLPSALTAGEVQWFTDYGSTGLGRLLVSNSSQPLARSFSCQQYNNLCQVALSPYNFENTTLNGFLTLSEIQPVFCVEWSPTSCYYQSPTGGGYSYSTTWSGGNSSYTSVSYSDNYTIQLQGISVGEFAVSANVESGSCQAGPVGGGGNVTPSLTWSNVKDLALASGDPNAITSNQITATGTPSGGTYSWTSNNSNVSLSNQNTATVTTTAATAGTSTITVTYTINNESTSGNMTVNVYQPSSVAVISDTGVQLNNVCYSGANQYNGPARSVQYQLQAMQNGSTVSMDAPVHMAESFSVQSSPPPSCGSAPAASSFTTQSTFTDNFNYCSTQCLPVSNQQPQGSCTLALEHVWKANGFNVFDHTLTYTCTNITPQ